MDLRKLSDEEVLERTRIAVRSERDATLEVLWHLREVDRRQLFALEHSSLFDYCVEELGYKRGCAHLRVSAMRLLRELPEFEPHVQSGALNLSLLAQAQTFLKKEKVRDLDRKREILEAVTGETLEQAQRILLSMASEPERHFQERVRPVSDTHSELRMVVDAETLEQLRHLQALLSHSHPGASFGEVIQVAVRNEIDRRAPRPEKPARSASVSSLKEVTPQQSEAEVRRSVWRRDGGRCGFVVDEKTGRKCGNRYRLEYDHVTPVAFGGTVSVDNLRLRCRTHNRTEAIRVFGHDKIAEFVPAMR